MDAPAGGASVRQAQLSIGAPVSISECVGNKGDEVNWKERLTTREKIFAVPVITKNGSTFTLGGGSALSEMKLYFSQNRRCQRFSAKLFNCYGNNDGLSAGDLIVGINPPNSEIEFALAGPNADPSQGQRACLYWVFGFITFEMFQHSYTSDD